MTTTNCTNANPISDLMLCTSTSSSLHTHTYITVPEDGMTIRSSRSTNTVFIDDSADVDIGKFSHAFTENNKRYYIYNCPGVCSSNVAITTNFDNPNKKMYLNICCEWDITKLHVKGKIQDRMLIDTDIYESWNWYVENGLLVVFLREKINERPKFEQC